MATGSEEKSGVTPKGINPLDVALLIALAVLFLVGLPNSSFVILLIAVVGFGICCAALLYWLANAIVVCRLILRGGELFGVRDNLHWLGTKISSIVLVALFIAGNIGAIWYDLYSPAVNHAVALHLIVVPEIILLIVSFSVRLDRLTGWKAVTTRGKYGIISTSLYPQFADKSWETGLSSSWFLVKVCLMIGLAVAILALMFPAISAALGSFFT